MKKLPTVALAIVLAISFILPAPGWCSEKVSCDSLKEISQSLEEVQSAFDKTQKISEGDEVDEALGELLEALKEVAEVEQDKEFDKSLDSLIDGYNNFDSDKFSSSLKAVINIFDKLYRRDC